MKDESREEERKETLEELSSLLFVIQELGSRLAIETHQEAYDMVRDFNEELHKSRVKLELIRKKQLNFVSC